MTQSDSSNFIVADDHPLFREALIHAIHNCVPGAVIHEADSLASLYEVVEAHPPSGVFAVLVDRVGRRVQVCVAGLPSPMVCFEGEWMVVEIPGNPPIGIQQPFGRGLGNHARRWLFVGTRGGQLHHHDSLGR